MQASFDAFALKPFAKALTCLSKYGDNVSIYATLDSLSLSCTNSSKSAYCQFRFGRQFFSKYNVGSVGSLPEHLEEPQFTGEVLAKPLLSILRHRTVEKAVERCEMSVFEGIPSQDGQVSDGDQGLESKLIIRLHCKHGVVKTHRLPLNSLSSLMAPEVPDTSNQSLLSIDPKPVKDIIEHFPLSKGTKMDPQLIWSFGESEVNVKSLESSIDTKGRIQLSTEMTVSADEFDVYNLYAAPTSIAFHLREFNATIAFAEAMSLPMEIRFTDPTAPLFVDLEGDGFASLFVISTSQVPGSVKQPTPVVLNNRKRGREDALGDSMPIRKPMKVVQAIEAPGSARGTGTASSRVQSVAPRSSLPQPQPPPTKTPLGATPVSPKSILLPSQPAAEPLFLPGPSQLSVVDYPEVEGESLELEEMFADSREASPAFNGLHIDDGIDLLDDSVMAPTQPPNYDDKVRVVFVWLNYDRRSVQAFHPLFED